MGAGRPRPPSRGFVVHGPRLHRARRDPARPHPGRDRAPHHQASQRSRRSTGGRAPHANSGRHAAPDVAAVGLPPPARPRGDPRLAPQAAVQAVARGSTPQEKRRMSKSTKLARGIYRRASGRILVAWRQDKRFCRHLLPRGATLTDAKKYRLQRLGEAASGALAALPGRFTYADLLALLGPRSRTTKALREAWPATMPAKELTADRIRTFERDRLAAGKARSTVNFDLAALRHAFNLALEAERVAKVPVIKTPTPDNVRTGFLERDVLNKVLEKLPTMYRPVVFFLYYTGWRVGSKRGETLHLRWRENVDWRGQVVRLEPGTTKNKQGREFPFGGLPALKALLEAQLAAAEPISS